MVDLQHASIDGLAARTPTFVLWPLEVAGALCGLLCLRLLVPHPSVDFPPPDFAAVPLTARTVRRLRPAAASSPPRPARGTARWFRAFYDLPRSI